MALSSPDGTRAAVLGGVRLLVLACVVLTFGHARADDCERVAVWRDGKRTQMWCRSEAVAHGLTVIDLGDDWVPPFLGPDDDGSATGYAATYRALAQERFADAGLDGELATRDRYLELFGIVPTQGVARVRIADDQRHKCHDAVDDVALGAVVDRIVEETAADGRSRVSQARDLRAKLEHDRIRKKLADLDALVATNKYYQHAFDRLNALERRIGAVRAIQAHLACDGLVVKVIEGAYTWQTSNAVEAFQRGAMILPSGAVDAQTREAFLLDSRERDFRTALRILRERVVAATGLLEDGTAGTGEGQVLGRSLVPEATWRVRGHDPLPNAAPDLISPATEAAAKALGWTDARSVGAFLDQIAAAETGSHLVAIELPPPPTYHARTMELSVEIDRGDVWRDRQQSNIERRPALTIYAASEAGRIPLARWPTTIGGWQNQKVDGNVEKQWKDSPVGPRIWRDLYIGPSWLPPATTPDRELVRKVDDHYVLAREQMGPSYRAAFGMVAFVHLKAEKDRAKVDYWDQGIRTHGTGNLASLANGVSHGCHRLLGYEVVRLANFVLAHRQFTRHGDTPTSYRRTVRAGGKFPLAIDSLGYRIELTPPIPVDVLPGRVR